MTARILAGLIVACSAFASAAHCRANADAAAPPPVTLENEYAAYRIAADGKNLSFLDKRTGKDYCAEQGRRPFATIKKGGAHHAATACTYAGGKIAIEFQPAGVTAVVKVDCKKHYFVFEVESVSDPEVDEISLVNLAVTSSGRVSGMSGVAADDEFATALRAANLQVLAGVGGNPASLWARCYRTYGLVGAKLALVGCPAGEIRAVLQEVVRDEGLPYSPLGGPFALDAEENRGSYVFASVSEANVEQWIEMAKKAGIAQVHFIGWQRSLGHYDPRRDLFPNGLEGLKATVDKLHAAGLKAGMHTLTGCISTHDAWATPVPDKRLATDATFTLAAAVDTKAQTVLVEEKPQEFDTVWAYASRGNVIRIDDELIQFSGLSREPPYGFTRCKRGAFGSRVRPHQKGAAVHHLYVRYGSFQPDENSTLVDELAGTIARVFNTCGFDMIYMDGAEGMIGGWHGVAKMREAIFRKLDRQVLVEASSWGYHSWPFHSRIGAWDHPNWGLKRFVDLHCRATEQYRRSSLLPAQLGWWAILGPNRDHRAELPDEIEYLCAKALALDAPMSFQGVQPGDRPANARQDEYLELIGRYERLRLAGTFPEAVKERLRQEREEFRLVEAADGVWQFVPTDYAVHKVTGSDDGTDTWTANNRYAAQPVRLRVEALESVEPYEAADALVLADFAAEGAFANPAAASGITHDLASSADQVKTGQISGCYSATNTGDSRRGAWARVVKDFAPPIDMQQHAALGVWVHGDGKGELLNLQLTNPRHYWNSADEHYVHVDFKGWRYFELPLRERDAEQFGDYVWPYGGYYAVVYRSPLIRSHVSRLSLYFNNLPPKDEVRCYLSPIKALRTKQVTLQNPRVTIGGTSVVFPVALKSGSYLEFTSASDCKLYDERGALLEEVQPEGNAPRLAAGENRVQFACEGPEGYRARANVTVISSGEPFGRPAAGR